MNDLSSPAGRIKSLNDTSRQVSAHIPRNAKASGGIGYQGRSALASVRGGGDSRRGRSTIGRFWAIFLTVVHVVLVKLCGRILAAIVIAVVFYFLVEAPCTTARFGGFDVGHLRATIMVRLGATDGTTLAAAMVAPSTVALLQGLNVCHLRTAIDPDAAEAFCASTLKGVNVCHL